MSIVLSYVPVSRETAPPSVARFMGEPVIRVPPHVYIDVIVKPVLKGIADVSTFFLQEKEVMGTMSEDFSFQFPATTGHHPREEPMRFEAIYDQIAFALDTSKPCKEGRASWNIPTILTDSRDPLYENTINVVQEYFLHNNVLTVMKGDAVLLESALF